jgi:hypothetical protein
MAASGKMQGKLTGYHEWVFVQLQEQRGIHNSDLSKRAWAEYVENHEAQLERWRLSPDNWKQSTSGNLAHIEVQRRRRAKKRAEQPERTSDSDGARSDGE